MKRLIVLYALLPYASPAWASVAFEDHATLPQRAWQFNTIGSVYPTGLKVSGGQVSELAPDAAFTLGQVAQEFRYGITDWLMLRTTVTLAMLRQTQSFQLGVSDLEAFVKAQLLEGPLHLSLGLQVTVPTAIPSLFSINGSTNLVPSLMMTHEGEYGSLNFTTSYSWGTNQTKADSLFHPPDTLFWGLAYNRDLYDGLTLTLETMGTRGYASITDGTADPDTENAVYSIGPGLTWAIAPGHGLLASLQIPYLRRGTMAATQAAFGFLQYSREF